MIPPRAGDSDRRYDMLHTMDASTLRMIAQVTARERRLIASLRGASMDESADKVAALLDVVRALDGLGARHALVGGVAVGLRSGVPRATVDTDIAVPSAVDRQSIIDALSAAGLRLTGTFAHSGVRVPVVTTADLIAMKERAAADPAQRLSKTLRDQADIALLRGDVPDADEGW